MNSGIFKNTKRVFMHVINILLIISMSAGCANDPGDPPDSEPGSISVVDIKPSDFIFRSEVIPFPDLPDGLVDINLVVLADDVVYFTARGDNDEQRQINVHGLFSMDFDGTNPAELTNYIPGALPADITSGYASIDDMHVDNEGNIWVAESRGFQRLDLPDDSSRSILRKLDKSGAEISVFDLSDLSDWVYVHAINVDDEGSIYLASDASVHILDNQGSLLFSLDNPGYLANLVWLSDGTVALAEQQDGRVYLKRVDTRSKSWGEIISLPPDVPQWNNVFSGNGEYLYLYNDSAHLNGIVAETGELVRVLSWVDSTLSSGEITDVMFLPDGRIAATRQTWIYNTAMGAQQPVTALILLTETSANEIPEKMQLTFGTFDFNSSIRYAVELFNSNSDTHSIQVTDYSRFNTDGDWSAGILRLSAEIIAGNAPDILEMRNMPIQNYVSKGLLVDLYPFLDADPELGRDSLIESVLKASEIDGSLYRIVPSFFIGTILGHPSVLGDYPGWNFDEFMVVLDENPQADLPLGPMNSKMTFLSLALRSNIEIYVDPVSGTASFENDDFISLLELANKFPPEQDTGNTVSSHRLISEGRQIMDMWNFWDFVSYPVWRTIFGGNLVFKGFPTENRDGNVFMPSTCIAITTNCAQPDAAWEFVRLFLLEDYQRDMIIYNMPANKIVFEERLNAAMKPLPGIVISTSDGLLLEDIKDIAISQEEADNLRDFIDNITRMRNYDDTLWTIVSEGADDFFNGLTTAQDAARIIQNRASIYLSEQS